jgi:effector-binding domain-containing protein
MVCDEGGGVMETQVSGCCSAQPWQEPYVRCRYAPQRTLSVRFRAPLEQLSGAVKASLENLTKELRAERATAMGAPFIAYHEISADRVDLEVGVPVSEHVHGAVEVHVGTLPMGRYVTVVQHGLPPSLGEIERALDRWLVLRHETAHGPLYVSVGHDSAPTDGRPIPCAFVERQIMAGEPCAMASPRRDASVSNEVMTRAAAVIGQLPRGLPELRAQIESPRPGFPMARARNA